MFDNLFALFFELTKKAHLPIYRMMEYGDNSSLFQAWKDEVFFFLSLFPIFLSCLLFILDCADDLPAALRGDADERAGGKGSSTKHLSAAERRRLKKGTTSEASPTPATHTRSEKPVNATDAFYLFHF